MFDLELNTTIDTGQLLGYSTEYVRLTSTSRNLQNQNFSF